jgi:signal transduction histidine kinase
VWTGALAIAVFQVVGTFGASDNQPDRRAVDAIAVALVLLGPAALLVRDRWPLVSAGVAIAAADVYLARGHAYGPIFVSVVVALFFAVQTGRRRDVALVGAAAWVGFWVASVLDPRADVDVVHLALVAGWLVVVLAVSDVVRVRREQAADRARATRDEQRLHLAQELHDVLAHNISLINVQASVALHLLEHDDDPTRPALLTIKDASRDSLRELRTALDVLRHGDDAPRLPAPRLADLDDLVAGVRAGGLDVTLERDGDTPDLPATVELAAYRVVQEALTNVTRHARAKHVTVRLACADDLLTVEVLDDGIGGQPAPGNGIGGMRERATSLGGTLEAGPGAGGGFRVIAYLPVGAP